MSLKVTCLFHWLSRSARKSSLEWFMLKNLCIATQKNTIFWFTAAEIDYSISIDCPASIQTLHWFDLLIDSKSLLLVAWQQKSAYPVVGSAVQCQFIHCLEPVFSTHCLIIETFSCFSLFSCVSSLITWLLILEGQSLYWWYLLL